MSSSVEHALRLIQNSVSGSAVRLVRAEGGDRWRILDMYPPFHGGSRYLQVPRALITDGALRPSSESPLSAAYTLALGARPVAVYFLPIANSEMALLVLSRTDIDDLASLENSAELLGRLLKTGSASEVERTELLQLNSLIENLPLPVMFVHSDSLKLHLNDMARTLLRVEGQQAQHTPSATRSALSNLLKAAAEQEGGADLFFDLRAELDFTFPHGGQTYRVQSRWISQHALEGRLWAFQDITQERRAQEALAILSSTDALTGLLNRRAWDLGAAQQIEQARRYGKPLSLLMLDIDHFKSINDELGHPTGDEVLKHVANIAQRVLRNSDVIGRYGGEEFAILLPETGLAGARGAAEKLRSAVSAALIDQKGRRVAITASIGVAEYDTGEEFKSWVERADQHLYIAKNLGRDRVHPSEFGACCTASE